MINKQPSFALATGLLLLAAVAMNASFGIGFPVPWVDESYFLWQALSFAHGNTMLTPELIPDRPVMWMQPGYVLLTGSFFKFVDFSLRHAREFTLAFYLAAMALYARAVCRERGIVAWVFSAVIFVIPSSIASSNVARMEAMVLALATGTLLATLGGRFVLALALTLLAGLIHFNGLYFFLVIALALVLDRRELAARARETRWWETGLLLLALGLIGAYIAFVMKNLEAFRIDMAFQFARKLERKPFYLDPRAVAVLALAVAVLGWMLRRGRRRDSLVACFALVAVLVFANGQEMWYQVFRNVGIGTLLMLLVVDLARPALRASAAVVALVGLVALAGGAGFVGMRPVIGGDYLAPAVVEALQARLIEAKAVRGGTLSVAFNNTGADMLFHDFLRDQGMRAIRRMPEAMTPPVVADVCVYLAGRGDPAWIRDDLAADLPDPALCRDGLFLSRSATEARWLTPTAHTQLLRELRTTAASVAH